MAAKGAPKTKKKKVKFTYVHRLAAAVSIVAFFVIIAAGVMGEARTSTIVFRSLIVMLLVGFVSRIVIRILAIYEEIHGGKA